MIIGVDEAGRGALAGPVVAVAVFMSETIKEKREIVGKIKDSKKLTDSQRRDIFEWLVNNVDYGVGVVLAREIDEIGIKASTEKVINLAVDELLKKKMLNSAKEEIKLLVDGRDRFHFSCFSEDIIKGDERVPVISAASIIAKVIRDDYMIELDKKYPRFGFAEHKGYGAKKHYDLLNNGVYCEEHRKTYNPLRTWLLQGRLF